MNCSTCGTEIGPEDQFCEQCGAPVAASPSTQPNNQSQQSQTNQKAVSQTDQVIHGMQNLGSKSFAFANDTFGRVKSVIDKNVSSDFKARLKNVARRLTAGILIWIIGLIISAVGSAVEKAGWGTPTFVYNYQLGVYLPGPGNINYSEVHFGQALLILGIILGIVGFFVALSTVYVAWKESKKPSHEPINTTEPTTPLSSYTGGTASLGDIVRTFGNLSNEVMKMSYPVKMVLLRDFKKRTGSTIDEMSQRLTSITRTSDPGDLQSNSVSTLQTLREYYNHLPSMIRMARFTQKKKDSLLLQVRTAEEEIQSLITVSKNN